MSLPIELVEEIMHCVVEVTFDVRFPSCHTPTAASRRDLLSCALSCSAFFHPTMEHLWSNSELMPLLKLLPGFKVIDSSYVLTGQLDEASLKRFDLYSSKVKTLVLYSPKGKDTPILVDKSVYTSLALLRPRPLLSLAHVYCYEYTEIFSNEMIFMISSSLESAAFQSCSSQDIMSYLSIIKNEGNRSTFHSLTLENLWGDIDLAYVSQLQNLQVFGLNIYLSSVENEAVLYPRYLKQLDLRGAFYVTQNIFTMLAIYRNSPVESFSLDASLVDKDFRKIFSVASSQWSRTVTTLSLDINMMEAEMGQEKFLDIVRPLFSSLHNIQFFTGTFIGLSEEVYVTGALISNISDAWHNLINLKVWTRHENANIALASLKTLSEGCLNLKQVYILFDTLHMPVVDHNEPEVSLSSSSHQLESLTLLVDASVLHDFAAIGPGATESLAIHLGTIFPYLEDIVVTTRGRQVEHLRREARRRDRSLTV
ncbi:hypothetical protein D9758_007498 [Tetrapyrgos nigripes]|uniref:Uncharacterized protein n=1 Tax=Tetrapyrgos nigripes TaxID=182062 RepID=A0A8H5G3E6_9AGAR|nr:hypothetical protein D9758_007498 [Tetrapyrgos nigripes]